jgi:D-glycero-D-manno-heptose 1,7-bisphosphate phosphatase
MPDAPAADGRRAVFLDRDGTIVEDPGFLHQPGKVRLLAGAGEAIRQLNRADWLVITVSNQSGIARGLYDATAYAAVQHRLTELLAAQEARLDGAYFCPHHPEFTGPCECRKPGLLLFREAGAALGLELARCVWVGDRVSDIQPARKLGGRALLVETGRGATHAGKARALGISVVADLAAAAAEIVRGG